MTVAHATRPDKPATLRSRGISQMSRRTMELLLLIAAWPVLLLLFALAAINNGDPLSARALAVPIGLAAAFIAAHLAIRRLAPAADAAILPIVFMLSGIGIAFVSRLAPDAAGRQVLWLFCSVLAMVATLYLVPSLAKLTEYKYTLMIAGLILLLLPAFIGTETYGSKLWLTFMGFSVQPGEMAKVLVALFLAGYLADNREMLSVGSRRLLGLSVPDPQALAPLLVMWAISLAIVVFERDLGSALLFFGIFLAMLFITTGRLAYCVGGLALAVVGVWAAWAVFSHIQVRVAVWLDPFAYRDQGGYQIVQALYSLADGGLIGTGIGRGMPEFIPVVAKDFIFVAIAEEMGLLGASGLLLLYLLLSVRGLSVAARARSDVDAFTAVGLTASIALQAFVIVGGTTKLIPMTGVTLPFVSQGGSSLLASFVIVGLLLRAGDSGTGHEAEMVGVPGLDGGILGRLTLSRRLTYSMAALSALFALLIVNLSWQMVVRAEALRRDPANSHSIARDQNLPRGAIVSADGVVLACSRAGSEGDWAREYPEGGLAAHVVGYRSPTYGAAGIEARYADALAGRTGLATWSDALAAAAGQQRPGNDVHLTIDSRVQRAADATLQGQTGAVVVLNARSGEVLGMSSSPGFDPADIDSILSGAGDDGTGSGGGDSRLYNRGTQALYATGSTFKTVTLYAALENGVATLDSAYDGPPRIEIGGADVTNIYLTDFGHLSLRRAFEVSSNTVFGQLAYQLGPDRLVDAAERLGFNRPLRTDFDVSMSLMPDPSEMTAWETAWAGIGQPVGQHKSPPGPQSTVLQMGMVAACVANGGEMMCPYLVSHVTSAEGMVVSQAAPRSLGRAMGQGTASQVREAMRGVVAQGTGTGAYVDGYVVCGKTGTAQTGNPADDSWFIGWIEVDGECYVVAVILEQVPAGSAPHHARQVFESIAWAYGR